MCWLILLIDFSILPLSVTLCTLPGIRSMKIFNNCWCRWLLTPPTASCRSGRPVVVGCYITTKFQRRRRYSGRYSGLPLNGWKGCLLRHSIEREFVAAVRSHGCAGLEERASSALWSQHWCLQFPLLSSKAFWYQGLEVHTLVALSRFDAPPTITAAARTELV